MRRRTDRRARTRSATRTVVGCALVVLLVLLSAGRADAAGVTTHAWMALEAIDEVGPPALAALLDAHRDQVEAGAQFPDSGYLNRAQGFPGGDYGEEAHWQRFYDAYADLLRDKPGCGDLTDPSGPCAPQIAHLFGAAAHGMGDEVWDWLFEPQAPDHGEQYLPPELAGIVGPGGIEFQMDMIAIADHGRTTSPDTPPIPVPSDLVTTFATLGRPDITDAGLQNGKAGMSILRAGEGALAPVHADRVRAAMPWTSANMVTAPGGVDFAARAIAALYETIWGRLLGDQPPTKVSITAPFDGQTDVPSGGWVRDFAPGSHDNGGGARNRIAAVLSYAMPYVPDAADTTTHIPAELPDGAMTLTDLATNTIVPTLDGYPRIVPYSPDAGEHVIDIQPAADLGLCKDYRVDVTDQLLDANGDPVTPMHWTFRTECALPTTTTTTTSASPASSGPTTVVTGPATSPSAIAAVPRFTG